MLRMLLFFFSFFITKKAGYNSINFSSEKQENKNFENRYQRRVHFKTELKKIMKIEYYFYHFLLHILVFYFIHKTLKISNYSIEVLETVAFIAVLNIILFCFSMILAIGFFFQYIADSLNLFYVKTKRYNMILYNKGLESYLVDSYEAIESERNAREFSNFLVGAAALSAQIVSDAKKQKKTEVYVPLSQPIKDPKKEYENYFLK